MSKKARKSPKKAPKKAGKSPVKYQRLPGPALEMLEEADNKIREEAWEEAHDLLAELNQVFPRRAEILDRLLQVSLAVEDMEEMVLYAEQLQRLQPDDASLAFRLGVAYFATGYAALAQEMLHRAENLDADDKEAAATLRLILEANLEDTAQQLHLEDPADLVALERTRLALSRQQPEEARRAVEGILARQPACVAALNQLSRVEHSQGNLEQALAAVEQVPRDHSLAGTSQELRVRYLAALGRWDEARTTALALAEGEPPSIPEWQTLIQNLLLVGEDQKAIEICGAAHQALDTLEEEAEEEGEALLEELDLIEQEEGLAQELDDELDNELDDGLDNEELDEFVTDQMDRDRALLLHLEAVATLRLGDEDRARELWEQALDLDPDLMLAEENLDDLVNPPGERDAPWAFDAGFLLPMPLMMAVADRLDPVLRTGRDDAIQRAARTALKHHPAMLNLMPLVLAQGGPRLRRLMLDLASFASTPQTLAILRDFAFSTHGPDELRSRAYRIVKEAGLLPEGPARLWLKGDWHEVELTQIEITSEPTNDYEHSPQVNDLLGQAMELLKKREGARAETLLRQALEQEPEALDLRFNLAQALRLQGQDDEYQRIVEELHDKYPDYLFAAAAKAQLLLREGRTEEAEALLGPLMQRRQIHVTELGIIYDVRIQLEMAQGNPRGVLKLLREWEQADPDSWGLQQWRERILTGAQLGLAQGQGQEEGEDR